MTNKTRIVALAMTFGVLALSSRTQELPRLQLKVEVAGEEHCQITPKVQLQRMRVKLQFLNIGRDDLTVQGVYSPGLIAVARNLGNAEQGVYEINDEGDPGQPFLPKNPHPFTLKHGRTYSTVETIGIPVREGDSEAGRNLEAVEGGVHYLQLGGPVMLGDSRDPRTLRNVSLRSAPIAVKVEYSDDPTVPACQREE